MGNVLHIPFQSIHRLDELRKNPSRLHFMSSFIEDVLVPGLRTHMKQKDPVLRVYAIDADEKPQTVDVHLQLNDIHGEPHQPWVFTFTSEKDEKDYTTFEEADCPFPLEPFFWDCEYFDKDQIIQACEAWSENFWPDFKPNFEYGYVERLLWDWDELFSEMFSDGLCQQWSIHPREQVTPEVKKALESLGSVVEIEDDIIITTTENDQLIRLLAKDWPELSLMPEDSGYE